MPIRAVGRSEQLAFTLIELMVLLSITGIVGALGVSAYQTYSIRAEITDGLVRGARAQAPILAAFKRDGEPPANDSAAYLSFDRAAVQSQFFGQFGIENGRIDLTYGGAADPAVAGRRLSLTPYETIDLEVVWICGNGIPGPGLQPLGFAGGGRQAVQVATTVEERYLPSTCR